MNSLSTRIILFAFFLIPPLFGFAQKISVSDLTVEHLENPLSIDASAPRLSWKIKSPLKNTLQTAYEIRVSTDASGKGIVWKGAGKTSQSVLIPYEGPALQSKTRYFWQVRVTDNQGNTSAWSDVEFWQTGLKPGDWTAKWIAVSEKDTLARSPLFRKEFSVTKKIRSAIAYVTAKGLYEAHINGQRVSDSYFAPGWTSYRKHLQYQVYDVTASLKNGANAVGVILGDGWYKGRIGFGNQRRFYGDTRALLLQLEIEYTDGTKQSINTDESWKTSYGPIMASDIYDGETYDARQEKPGWATAGYAEGGSWANVRILEKGTEQLVGMSGPMVKKV